jgi:hypothetical protein
MKKIAKHIKNHPQPLLKIRRGVIAGKNIVFYFFNILLIKFL